MKKTRQIEFEIATVFGRAAVAAIRASLAGSHGSAFADAFVADHIGAIQRASRARLNGRVDAEMRMELHALRRLGQGSLTHD
jgi:hypothetical protein